MHLDSFPRRAKQTRIKKKLDQNWETHGTSICASRRDTPATIYPLDQLLLMILPYKFIKGTLRDTISDTNGQPQITEDDMKVREINNLDII